MLSVRAIYDGQNVTFQEPVAVKKPQRVIVVFLDDPENEAAEEPLAEKFERLFEQWYAETAILNGSWVTNNPNHQKMIDMGEAAIPMMLKKLQEKPCLLFDALSTVSGQNPVPKEHQGKFQLIVNDWLQWGRENHYIQ